MERLAAALLAGAIATIVVWWLLARADAVRTRLTRALGVPEPRPRPPVTITEPLALLGRALSWWPADVLGGRPALTARLPEPERDRWYDVARGLAVILAAFAVAVAIAFGPLWLLVLPLTPLAARWPIDVALGRRAAERRRAIERDVTPALDVFVLGLDAGLPFERALAAYVENVDSPLGDELAATMRDLEVGYRRREVMHRAAVRTGSAALAQLATTVRLAEDFGTPLADALRGLAVDTRAQRRLRLQEAALRAPITMLLPTAAFILVPIFAIVLGPIVLRVLGGSLF